jgi:hypothetical protein
MQPWVLTFLRACVEILLSVLYIPLISNAITTFDCFIDEDGKNYWRADRTIVCLSGNMFQIIGALLGMLFLIILITYAVIIRIFIFNHNPKSYSIFTCRNGGFSVLE